MATRDSSLDWSGAGLRSLPVPHAEHGGTKERVEDKQQHRSEQLPVLTRAEPPLPSEQKDDVKGGAKQPDAETQIDSVGTEGPRREGAFDLVELVGGYEIFGAGRHPREHLAQERVALFTLVHGIRSGCWGRPAGAARNPTY